MPPDVNVSTDPVIVYGMIGLLVGAIVLAIYFSRPRRGLGAATKSDAAQTPPGEAWLPGGDIFGREKPMPQPDSPEAPYDPWSTTPDQSGQQPRWDRG